MSTPRPRKLAVGQRWTVHAAEHPNWRWTFRIVHAVTWEGATYYVALKEHVQPDSLQVVVFDACGTGLDAGLAFQCVRRLRDRP